MEANTSWQETKVARELIGNIFRKESCKRYYLKSKEQHYE